MDEKRILSKIDQLDLYLEELKEIKPSSFKEYSSSIEKKRACERLLHVSIEIVIDIANLIVSNLKLGLPSDDEEVFQKLLKKGIISNKMTDLLIDMKNFRNVLVHRYGEINDRKAFENIKGNLGDFEDFKEEILKFLRKSK